MPRVDCQKSTSGGKGNKGMFIERDKNVCAAGLPTQQADNFVEEALEHYLLKDEVDALMSDAIIPPAKPRPLPPLRNPLPLDKRFAGIFCDVAQLLNPPIKTKFQTLVSDFKDTPYASYWKKPLASVKDPVPMLPEGFDMFTTFGKKTPFHGRLYDIVMPKVPYEDKTPPSKYAGVQLDRNYCAPPYNPDLTYGHRTFVDKRGTYAKCCLSDDRVVEGTGNRVIINDVQANFLDIKQPRVGSVLAPNDNVSNVPEGYSFGILKRPDNVPDCLTTCKINPGKKNFRKCLTHLNSLRKCLSKRFLSTFFKPFYLSLKFYDKDKTGWLDKTVLYNSCGFKMIRFNPELIEPLLSSWQAFDGSRVEYETFVRIINYTAPLPDLPKVPDLPEDCIDFRTTYTEMTKPNQETDNRLMAGLPSGRYFDLDYPITPEYCCKADRTCLLQESDVKSCLCPSVLTLLHINHRDMYAKRDPAAVKRVFEAAGENFSEERFNAIWEDAQKYHSKGWVCYETFRRALEANPHNN